MPKTRTKKQAEPKKDTQQQTTVPITTDVEQPVEFAGEADTHAEELLPVTLDESVGSNSVVDIKLIDQAVGFINEKYNENAYKMAIEIGAYVLKNFFDDDIASATSKNPKKPASFRALCRNEKLIPRPEALSVMVRVAAQEKFFLDKKLDTASLSYTHKTELVKLPNDGAKVKFVKFIMQKALSCRELEKRVKDIRKKDGKPRNISQLLDAEMDNPQKLFGEATVLETFQDTALLQEELRQLKKKKLRRICENAMKRAEETQRWSHLYQTLVDTIEGITREE
jgi:hypothetical protein